MKAQEIERLTGIESQVKLLKWIFGITFLLVVGWGGYIYAQGRELSSLKQRAAFYDKTSARTERVVDAVVGDINLIKVHAKVTKLHIKHINEALLEIKELLKSRRK